MKYFYMRYCITCFGNNRYSTCINLSAFKWPNQLMFLECESEELCKKVKLGYALLEFHIYSATANWECLASSLCSWCFLRRQLAEICENCPVHILWELIDPRCILQEEQTIKQILGAWPRTQYHHDCLYIECDEMQKNPWDVECRQMS